jgi:cell division protein FtsN
MSRPNPSRTPRNARSKGSPPSARGSTLLGIFIGVIIGLGIAAAVAFWLMKNNPAFVPAQGGSRETAKDATRTAKSDVPEKPRFDFYKILPGAEEARVAPERKAADKSDRAVVDQAKERSVGKTADATPERANDKVANLDTQAKAPRGGARYWLQTGSFSTESDAENLKARLAFAGWEATVQQGVMPDKALRYRVRLGPYDNQDEMQRIKSELGRRGFEAAVIKY